MKRSRFSEEQIVGRLTASNLLHPCSGAKDGTGLI